MTLADIKIKPLVWTEDDGYTHAEGVEGRYTINLYHLFGARFYSFKERGAERMCPSGNLEKIQQGCNEDNKKRALALIAQIVEVEP